MCVCVCVCVCVHACVHAGVALNGGDRSVWFHILSKAVFDCMRNDADVSNASYASCPSIFASPTSSHPM